MHCCAERCLRREAWVPRRATIPVFFALRCILRAVQGYAYIEFLEADAVANALLLDGSELRGRALKVLPKRTNVPGLRVRPLLYNPINTLNPAFLSVMQRAMRLLIV